MPRLTPQETAFYIAEADMCEKRQKRELIESNNYPFIVRYYEGKFQINASDESVSTHEMLSTINEYFPNTNALISEIMYQNPDIIAQGLKPEAESGEPVMKSALDYLFDHTGALVENRVALFDMFSAGYCGVEVGHLPKKDAPDDTLPFPTTDQMLEREQTVVQKLVNKFKKPQNEEQAEQKLEAGQGSKESSVSTNDGTYIMRYDPLDILFDWQAERLRFRRYSLKKVRMTKAKFDITYPHLKDKVIVGDRHDSLNDNEAQNRSNGLQKKHQHKVLLYEFQIPRGKEMWTIIVTPNLTTQEVDMFKRPYVTNGYDMKIGTLHKYGKVYPVSFFQINKKMADEMESYIRAMMDIAERNVPKIMVDKNKVKGSAIDALRSNKTNDIAEIDGNPQNCAHPLPATSFSSENKELLAIFEKQKQKLWSVSNQALGDTGGADFATELKIQEAGFARRNIDIQEGMRQLLQEELDTGKDIIVTFWDGPIFLKITGGQKPEWYETITAVNPLNGKEMVLNPLTDLLTGDYFIKVDISKSLRPNKEKMRADAIEFLTWLMDPIRLQYLTSQGIKVNPEEIKRVSDDFGFQSDVLLIPMTPEEDAQANAPESLDIQGAGGAGASATRPTIGG